MNMFGKITPKKYFCGFDLGTLSVKAALLKDQDQKPPELIGVYESKTAGFKNGVVTDLSELSDCVNATIAGLTAQTGVKFKDLQLGVGGEIIQKVYATAVIPLLERGSKVISPGDVRKVSDQAKLLGAAMEDEVIHNFPQYYKVDDVNTALNPLGLYGRKIEIYTLLMLVKNAGLQNLVKAVNQAGYNVSDIYYTSYSSAEACLSEYHRRQGCMLADIGSQITDILIFKDGFLRYAVTVPMGGDHLTQSLANRLGITFELAEEIKKSYAYAITGEGQSDEEILIKNTQGYTPIKKQALAHSLEPAVARFVDLVGQAVKNSNLENEIKAGIVMTGGGSLLPGLEERLELGIKLPVNVAKINITSKRLPQAPKYCGAIGLAQTALARTKGIAASQDGAMNLRQRLAYKVVELYQEYF